MNSTDETLREIIKTAVKYARSVSDDQEALGIQYLYKEWHEQIGRTVNVGEYIQYEDKLYRVIQSHTISREWAPSLAPALFVVIDKEHTGTLDDPIPAQLNMEYFADKYYIENGVIYKCIRDSGIALAYLPSALVGNYFEVVNK